MSQGYVARNGSAENSNSKEKMTELVEMDELKNDFRPDSVKTLPEQTEISGLVKGEMPANKVPQRVKYTRFILFATNVLQIVVGILLIAGAVALEYENAELNPITTPAYSTGITMLVICGVLMEITAIFGFLGLTRLWRPWLSLYIRFLVAAVILQTAAGVLAFVYRLDIAGSGGLSKRVGEAIGSYSMNRTNSTHDFSGNATATAIPPLQADDTLDYLQNKFHCCGVDAPSNWYRLNPHYIEENGFPESCLCNIEVAPTNTCILASSEVPEANGTVWKSGCLDAFGSPLTTLCYIVGGFCVGLAVFELVVILLSSQVVIYANSLVKRATTTGQR